MGGNLDANDKEVTDVAKLGVGTDSPTHTAHVNYSKTSDSTIGFRVSYNSSSFDGKMISWGEGTAEGGVLGKADGYGLDASYIANGSAGLRLQRQFGGTPRVTPCDNLGALNDNAIDLGTSNGRFDDVYATNGTIQTSDRNEKQDIQLLYFLHQTVALYLACLLYTSDAADE